MNTSQRKLYSQPIILPLDCNGRIYAIQDEYGNTIGTGTRDICEALVHIIQSQPLVRRPMMPVSDETHRNIRAAIVI